MTAGLAHWAPKNSEHNGHEERQNANDQTAELPEDGAQRPTPHEHEGLSAEMGP